MEYWVIVKKIIFNINKSIKFTNSVINLKNIDLILLFKINYIYDNDFFFFNKKIFECLVSSINNFYFFYKIVYAWYIYNVYYLNIYIFIRLHDNLYKDYVGSTFYNNIYFKMLNKKQLRLTFRFYNSKIINITTGKILASLNISKKSQKKTYKSEKLFIEYLKNYIHFYFSQYIRAKKTIFKITNLSKDNRINKRLLKLLFRKFNITAVLTILKFPNKIKNRKKVRSIKKRLKKLILKKENY